MSAINVQWTPNEQGLQQILQLLADSKKGSTEVQKHCTEQFAYFNKNVVDFNNYLAFIFVQMKQQDPSIRQAAGLLLKTNLRRDFETILPQAMEHIKALILEGIRDPIHYIRSTAGNVMTSLIYHQGLKSWPQALPTLVQYIESNDFNTVDGSFSALLKICEDIGDQLDSEELGRPLNFLIPKFIQYMAHPHESIRKMAVACVIQFLPLMPNALLVNMEQFMKRISSMANDQSSRIRKYVCRAFIALLEHPNYLKPIFDNVVDYIIHCTTDTSDEVLALEACEFWTAIAENESCHDFMKPLQAHLPKIVPILVKGMVYNEMNRQILDEESYIPDSDQDIKPFFPSSKARDFHNPNAAPSLLQGDVASPNVTSPNEEEDDDDDFDSEFDGHSDWNLRKCSASSLDIFSNIYGNDLLVTLLPEIQKRLQNNVPWEERECAILALGAIAEGCKTGMYKHLPSLIPYLIGVLNDPKPLVRSITCWTLSRYSKWIVEQPNEDEYFKPLLAALLQKIIDSNKRVQEAACSAFATLEEVAHMRLVPYLPHILKTFQGAFDIYQKKNLFILYDAIRTLADVVGQELNKQTYINMLMPPLINKWNKLADNDKNIFPLLECLTGVATALQSGFIHFAAPVYQRCLRLIENTYVEQEQARMHKDTNTLDKDFIVCSLDLMSGIIEALGPSVEELIAKTNTLVLVKKCMLDREYDVRQSAFGVVGDMAKICIGQLRPVLGDYLVILIKNISSSGPSVASNACWAIGVISLQIGVEMKPFISDILQKTIPLINQTKNNISLAENVAITLGRLGLVCPDAVAPHLPTFSQNWCLALHSIRNQTEKEHAYKGLCTLIRFNPQGVFNTFPFVCDAIASYDNASIELKQEFHKILHGFKQSMGQQPWQAYFARFPDKLQAILRTNYGL